MNKFVFVLSRPLLRLERPCLVGGGEGGDTAAVDILVSYKSQGTDRTGCHSEPELRTASVLEFSPIFQHLLDKLLVVCVCGSKVIQNQIGRQTQQPVSQ